MILGKISLSAGTTDDSKLLQVTYKENTAGNLRALLDLADDVEAGGEVKKNLVFRKVGGQKLNREKEAIVSIRMKW